MLAFPFSYDQINIEDFNICHLLNSGAFGYVYLVEDHTSKKYAAKVIDSNNIDPKMIIREIGILISVKHPTIVKCFGYSLVDFYSRPNTRRLQKRKCRLFHCIMFSSNISGAMKAIVPIPCVIVSV